MLRPGDVLYLRRGTYAENLVDKIPSGTVAALVKVASYPKETAILRPGKGNYVVRIQGARSYITLDGLTLDGRGTASANVWINTLVTGTPSHIRIQNCEITNAGTQGVLVESLPGYPTPDHNQFVKLRVHDNGKTDLHHGLYIQSSHNLVDGCEVFRNAGFGLQVYKSGGKSGIDAGHNTVRNSRFHDNGRIGGRGVGIGVYVGTGNLVYNNLVWKNQTGISVGYGAADTRIFHNDVYANTGIAGINVGYTGGARNTTIQNNIIYQNSKGDIKDFGTSTTADHNTLNTTDPHFRDAAHHDFRLAAASPAVDAGTTLSVVTSDADGVPRPQGHAYDIGAYERR